ncbi:hypothetical protein [Paludisphaera rhizosphaerae]|uniref:hypothetical protein n=1 Tax=Paludisphaera rhizosphaerae TaxID=2711216 RepID=UPI0013EA6129|nr:hypothetical protein [Paludisphaera rhizosphaerae]
MSVEIRGGSDASLEAIASKLQEYQATHPLAQITIYRYSLYSIRIRIVDPSFEKLSRSERNDLIWDHLDELDEEVSSDVNMLLLRTPDELKTSAGNMEFEHPSPPLSLNGSATE